MKFPPELLQRCWFLAGPTAVGKSALSLLLAERLGGEIVSMDSMAIYRHMDIGTAKPAPAELALIPHHLIDIVEPHQEYSTAEFLNASIQACEQIVQRGHVPIFVGGTGLYLRSLLRGVFEGPSADWGFREELLASAAKESPDWLHRRLQQVDPVTAARLHPNDERRLVRALEIHALTGAPPSELHQERPLPLEERPQHVYWLHPPRDWLYERINRRVSAMMDRGLEEEVQQLMVLEHPPGKTARQALGYREVIDFQSGLISSREEMIDLIQTRTRQFAKRQHTWFRNLEECREVTIQGTESPEELLKKLGASGLPS
ncbi:tRNA (adenosine(37)-N6)-dimethylallyltransferase MiaA [Planctomicrobium sp. SH661]|uniref:tRNA (adenosine(37)-N6)-dimethylallyltransferase MiaA n=1 Tax=Planctomicrobium sp. SH661 TaxID=3448124 RepID=UPI003F5B462F